MDLIIADHVYGADKNVVDFDADFQVGEADNTFVVSVPYSKEDELGIDMRVYVKDYEKDNEFGGLIVGKEVQTEFDQVLFRGVTWRGLLTRCYVIPTGSDGYYHTLAGDANAAIDDLMSKFFEVEQHNSGDPHLYKLNGSSLSGITVTSQSLRFCSVYEGISRILASATVPAYPRIRYIEGDVPWLSTTKAGGYFQVYAEETELRYYHMNEFDDDGGVDAVYSVDYPDQTFVVIGLGSGELTNRTVVYVYRDDETGDVTWSTNWQATPLSENYEHRIGCVWTDVVDYSGATKDELIKSCTDRFAELENQITAEIQPRGKMNDVDVGDRVLIWGLPYPFGEQFVRGKIWKRANMAVEEDVLFGEVSGSFSWATGGSSSPSGAWVEKDVPLYELDTSAASGTLDGNLYAAINNLGWTSEVIV